MNTVNEDNITFEKAMSRLEEVVRLLENSETTLDSSLDLYKEGIELVHFCSEKLDNAQQKITQLKDSDIK